MSARRTALAAAGVFGLALPALAGLGYTALAALGLAGAGGGAFTLAHLRAVAADAEVRASLAWTLATSAAGTLLALEGAVRAAARVRPDGALARVLLAPLAVPHVGAALAMLWLLAPAGLVARLLHAVGLVATPADMPRLVNEPAGIALVLAVTWKELPFLLLVALGAVQRDAVRLVEAARTVGAPPRTARRRVVHPHLRRATLPAAVAVFAFVAGQYELPVLLGPTSPPALAVLGYERWTDVLLARRGEAYAVSLVAIVPALAAAWAGARAWRRATT